VYSVAIQKSNQKSVEESQTIFFVISITIKIEVILVSLPENKTMRDSNFWYYFIMVVVILHFVLGFGYLIYKLSPRKSDKKKDEILDKDDSFE